MSNSINLSRRHAMRLLSSVPLLPLGGSLAATSLLSACGGDSDNGGDPPPVTVESVAFTAMAAPSLANAAAMATTSVGSTMVVTLSDGSSQSYTLGYKTFFATGAEVPDGHGGTLVAGGYRDIHNQPIVDASGATPRQFFSDCPDGSSLLTVDGANVAGVTGNTVFAVVQFEYATRNLAAQSMYGQLPSPIAVLTLDQNATTGELALVKYHHVDTSGVNGLWITCGASRSPWNTHLSSEEYEPDAWTIASNTMFQAFSTNLYGSPTAANPYHYGHLPEVTVLADGTATIAKHYCMGRISHELVQVMPDERTVLMGDDATNGALFMFVADVARDLSAGTLYAAKWTAVTTTQGGSGTLSWIKLGHSTSEAVKGFADAFTAVDLMDVRTTDPSDASYTQIKFNGGTQWVKFTAGREEAAAFLETHRYAAFKGASMAFTKMEGTTVNVADKVAYSAMSSIKSAMQAALGLDKAIAAGAVYALNLSGSQTDNDGNAIASEWVPVDMAPVAELIGEDLAAPDGLGNTAHADKLGNPDNLKFSEKLRTLFIGEDSGMHVNNFLWAYNVDTKVLSRVLSCPSGAESTGLHAVDDINGFAYVMSNFQHPGDWESVHAVVEPTLDPLVRANYNDRYSAAVGYLTGMPVTDQLAG
ncbi:MAG TPA: alkaline phosphatase PhoX [Albitalea sp.]|nr:alkaline phosphatase PhoX [Albitalea sp.]